MENLNRSPAKYRIDQKVVVRWLSASVVEEGYIVDIGFNIPKDNGWVYWVKVPSCDWALAFSEREIRGAIDYNEENEPTAYEDW